MIALIMQKKNARSAIASTDKWKDRVITGE
jgi:hypothetical protein